MKKILTMANGTDVLVEEEVATIASDSIEYFCPQCHRPINPGHALALRHINLLQFTNSWQEDIRCAVCQLTPDLRIANDWDTSEYLTEYEQVYKRVRPNGVEHDPDKSWSEECFCENCQWGMAQDLVGWEDWFKRAQYINALCELIKTNPEIYPNIDPEADLPWMPEVEKPLIVQRKEQIEYALNHLPHCQSCEAEMEAFGFEPYRAGEGIEEFAPGTAPRGKIHPFDIDSVVIGGAQIICARNGAQAMHYAANRRVECDVFTLGDNGQWKVLKRDKRHT